MPLCLSIFHHPDPDVLANHAHYARMHGYPHCSVASEGIFHPHLQDAYRAAQMLRHLRTLPEGDWLLVLDQDAVVFHPAPMESLLGERDALLVEGPAANGFPAEVMRAMRVLRNTGSNRLMLHELAADASQVIALESDRLDESARFRAAGAFPCNAVLNDCYVCISWRTPGWQNARIFVVDLSPLPVKGRHGVQATDILHDRTLQQMLVRQMNRSLTQGAAVLAPPAYPPLSTDALSSYNAQASIAFVMLYTEHIAAYARVAEHNVKRYCDRHGYALHVYRRMPAALGEGVQGNWAKPWVLRQHFGQHEWVIWIDADMVFVNPARRIEDLLAGRELLLARDIGAWRVNSGLMGFKRTPANDELLAALQARIAQVPDKSSVYASMGDQYYVNAVLRERGLDGPDQVLDMVSVNTPHYLRTDDTFLMHFLGLAEPYRSVYMADQDQASLRR